MGKFHAIWFSPNCWNFIVTTDFDMKFAPKIYERQILRKMTHQNCNQHITMCPCIKFQSIRGTLQSWAKGCRQIHEVKQNRFFYEMFYS